MQIRNASDLAKYDALSIQDRQRAYCEMMSSGDRKRMGELRLFVEFIEASRLPIDLSTVVCLDPPSPDISCNLDSSPYLFELGEVTDEGLLDLRGAIDQLLSSGFSRIWLCEYKSSNPPLHL
jgi:hypothetical protein